MTPDQSELIDKADKSLQAARLLLQEGYSDFAASRAYYAMFYASEALLEGEGLAFSSHSAVVAAFGKEFARGGRVPQHLHGWLTKAMDLRHAGDYGAPGAVSVEDAREQIDRADDFVREVRSAIEKQA